MSNEMSVITNVLNLTQHPATPDQLAAGVADLPAKQRAELSALLTFDTLPTAAEVVARAEQIAQEMHEEWTYENAMIGGAPYLMAPLDAALRKRGITPVYAFSRRESVEQVQPDGSVRKVNVFKHGGFV